MCHKAEEGLASFSFWGCYWTYSCGVLGLQVDSRFPLTTSNVAFLCMTCINTVCERGLLINFVCVSGLVAIFILFGSIEFATMFYSY